jgi:hypothetical protein
MVNGPGNFPELRKIQPLPQAAPPPKPEQKFLPKPEPRVEPAAQVTISHRAKEIQSVLPRVQAIPEVRPNRVEEVRAKLSNVANVAAQNAKVAEKLLTGD